LCEEKGEEERHNNGKMERMKRQRNGNVKERIRMEKKMIDIKKNVEKR
jgi:hypothetical protein